MRAYRKRSWATLAVNMTPLIDVVFLIIIFFIILINFSEMHIRKVNLPKADEAHQSRVDKSRKIPVIIKSEDMIFLDRKKIYMRSLADILKTGYKDPNDITVQIRADENVPYEVIKQVMHQLSLARVSKIEFSTLKEDLEPLEKVINDEN